QLLTAGTNRTRVSGGLADEDAWGIATSLNITHSNCGNGCVIETVALEPDVKHSAESSSTISKVVETRRHGYYDGNQCRGSQTSSTFSALADWEEGYGNTIHRHTNGMLQIHE